MNGRRGQDGYFPAGSSILRRVHSERAVGLLYGQRALMLGALNPLAFIGTTQRSKALNKPWKRLTHTAEMFEAVFFGSREQADKALAFTARLHQRVNGEIPEPAGPYPAGTRYDAFDPELMLWVIAPMYDSAKVLYELLVRRLSDAEREQLWQEYIHFAELFGMPRRTAPPNTIALDAWWARQLSSDRVFLTDTARAVGQSIGFKLPVPTWTRPAMVAAGLILRGSLPAPVRDHYQLPWSRGDQVAFRALTRAHRTTTPLVPAPLRRGSTMPFYKLIARREHLNLQAGIRSFEIPHEPRSQTRRQRNRLQRS